MASLGVGSWIARRRMIAPDAIALVCGEQQLTYAEFDDRICKLANALRGLGVAAGDRVAYLGPNHPAFLELMFAATSIGAIALPVNYRLATDVVAFIIDDAAPRLVVHASEASRTLSALDDVDTRVSLETGYEALLGDGSTERADAVVGFDDAALLTYTSGTTGRPKGVVLSHANLTFNAMNWLISGDFRPTDVSLAIAPFFRVGGLAVTLLETFLVGGAVVVMGEFEPRRALQLVERHRVSVLFGGPELLRGLEADASFATVDFSSVRVCYTGGAPVPEPLLRSYFERGIPIVQGYGLSEAGPLVLLLDPRDMVRKAGSAGRPVFFTESRVVGPDGPEVAPGQVGEIMARGPNVMRGYWNNPEATAAAIVEGSWLRTGDAARIDDEGFVTIVGRMTDAITVGDTLAFPGDIERVLLEHPAVADAAVVGRPDDALGETGVGFVVPKGDAELATDDVLAWVQPQLARGELLTEIRFVEQIERNPAGKILRHELRALLAAEK
jgi:acyl-CoA synthetase (AMP-forming)/AMP-acid ligase II